MTEEQKEKIKAAVKKLNQAFHESCGGEPCPREADEDLNQASRNVIEAYGVGCWLGVINPFTEAEKENPLWQWGLKFSRNFGSSFVIPEYDAELEKLLKARLDAPYEGTKKDAELVDAIYRRVEELGGSILIWS